MTSFDPKMTSKASLSTPCLYYLCHSTSIIVFSCSPLSEISSLVLYFIFPIPLSSLSDQATFNYDFIYFRQLMKSLTAFGTLIFQNYRFTKLTSLKCCSSWEFSCRQCRRRWTTVKSNIIWRCDWLPVLINFWGRSLISCVSVHWILWWKDISMVGELCLFIYSFHFKTNSEEFSVIRMLCVSLDQLWLCYFSFSTAIYLKHFAERKK